MHNSNKIMNKFLNDSFIKINISFMKQILIRFMYNFFVDSCNILGEITVGLKSSVQYSVLKYQMILLTNKWRPPRKSGLTPETIEAL